MNNFIIALLALGAYKTMTKRTWAIPSSGQAYQAALMASENKHKIPHNLLARVAYQESRFRPDIITGATVSSANAQGIMQIVPKWHPDVDPLDPWDAIDYAGQYLSKLKRQFGTWEKALAAYNWGPGNLNRAIKQSGDQWMQDLPGETFNYVTEITGDVIA